jgi:hypothetical protein
VSLILYLRICDACVIFQQVNPQFYAFRWITLLLTQEFSFFDSIRLWDSLLSNPDGPLVSVSSLYRGSFTISRL